jgi:hypothetical protein
MGGGGPAQRGVLPRPAVVCLPSAATGSASHLSHAEAYGVCHSLPRSPGGGVHYCPLQFVVWQSSTQCLGPSCTPLQLAWARRVSSDTARRCPLS